MGNCNMQSGSRGSVVLGIWLMLLGGVLALQTTGLVSWPRGGPWWLTAWALVSLTLGVSRLFPSGGKEINYREAFGHLFFGSWLLLNQLHVLRYRESWPVLLVGIGIGIVWSALASRRPARIALPIPLRCRPSRT